LLWAGGILWTAVDVAGVSPSKSATAANVVDSVPTDATDVPVDQKNLAILANVMGN
jgi:hypothetical protein